MRHIVQKPRILAERSLPCPILAVLVAAVLLLAVTVAQAASPEQACKSGKNKTAGRYAACRENAEAKLAKGGDPSKYNEAIGKCASKFSFAWQKLEALASCPADDTVIKGKTDAYTDTVAALIGGVGSRFVDNGDGTVTDHQTGLQWEKKQNLDDVTDFADPHDADNYYTWGGSWGCPSDC